MPPTSSAQLLEPETIFPVRSFATKPLRSMLCFAFTPSHPFVKRSRRVSTPHLTNLCATITRTSCPTQPSFHAFKMGAQQSRAATTTTPSPTPTTAPSLAMVPDTTQATMNAAKATDTVDESSAPLSKNQLKKRLRNERYLERKRARKASQKAQREERRLQKQRERDEYWNSLPESERIAAAAKRKEDMRRERAKVEEKRVQLRDTLRNGGRYSVCVDLGWNEVMNEKELKSLTRQLAYCYSAMRKAVERGDTPMKVSVTGVDEIVKRMLTVTSQNWESWPITMTADALDGHHDRGKLVYLSHDSENVLDELNEDDVYVIGGIVDRGRLKRATIDKAIGMNVRTARLNLDANVAMQHGTKVLTVNHCVEILVHKANGKSWKEAYLQVLPERKGIVSQKNEDGEEEEDAGTAAVATRR